MSRIRRGPGSTSTSCRSCAQAVEIGSPRIANVVALGALACLGRLVSDDVLEQAVRLETPPKFADLNLAAVREGRALARETAGA